MSNQSMAGGSQKITSPFLTVAVTESRDLKESDNGFILECSGTITLNAPSIWRRGFQVVIVNVGVGVITITADGTLLSKAGANQIDTQYAAATLYNRGNNEWVLLGDIV